MRGFSQRSAMFVVWKLPLAAVLRVAWSWTPQGDAPHSDIGDGGKLEGSILGIVTYLGDFGPGNKPLSHTGAIRPILINTGYM